MVAPAFERGLEQPVAGAIPVPPEAGLVVTEGNYLLLDSPAWLVVRAGLDAVWVGGALRTARRDTSMGVSAYAMDGVHIERYVPSDRPAR